MEDGTRTDSDADQTDTWQWQGQRREIPVFEKKFKVYRFRVQIGSPPDSQCCYIDYHSFGFDQHFEDLQLSDGFRAPIPWPGFRTSPSYFSVGPHWWVPKSDPDDDKESLGLTASPPISCDWLFIPSDKMCGWMDEPYPLRDDQELAKYESMAEGQICTWPIFCFLQGRLQCTTPHPRGGRTTYGTDYYGNISRTTEVITHEWNIRGWRADHIVQTWCVCLTREYHHDSSLLCPFDRFQQIEKLSVGEWCDYKDIPNWHWCPMFRTMGPWCWLPFITRTGRMGWDWYSPTLAELWKCRSEQCPKNPWQCLTSPRIRGRVFSLHLLQQSFESKGRA